MGQGDESDEIPKANRFHPRRAVSRNRHHQRSRCAAPAGYHPSHPEVLSYLTGSYTPDVINGYDHVVIWNPLRLETVTTDITGRYVKIKGLKLKPNQMVRLIIKRDKGQTFVFLPGGANAVTLTSKAIQKLQNNAWSITGKQATKFALGKIPSDKPTVSSSPITSGTRFRLRKYDLREVSFYIEPLRTWQRKTYRTNALHSLLGAV